MTPQFISFYLARLSSHLPPPLLCFFSLFFAHFLSLLPSARSVGSSHFLVFFALLVGSEIETRRAKLVVGGKVGKRRKMQQQRRRQQQRQLSRLGVCAIFHW